MQYLDLKLKRADIRGLLRDSALSKPATMDRDVSTLRAYYDDTSSGLTMRRLQELGMGIADNRRPLEVSLLRWVIDQLAVVYSSAPTRWLVSNGRRIVETGDAAKAMRKALTESRYDLAWREVDRMRALCRQAVIRIFAIDETKSLTVRVFGPDAVHRVPDPAVGDSMDLDSAFALSLSGDAYEVWERMDNQWACARVDREGGFLDDASQPFVETGYLCPYDELPVQIIYDGASNGSAWLQPRTTRISAVEAVNVLLNEAMVLVQKQAHASRFISGMRPEEVPTVEGPGVTTVLPNESARAYDLTPSPAIDQVVAFARETIRTFLRSEGLPADSFETSARVLTGSALRAQMRELIERRRIAGPLAQEDERQTWRRFVAVQSAHAEGWGVPSLPAMDLEIEIGAMEIASDPREVIDVTAREMAIGIASKVDAVMRLRTVSREEAVKILEQVASDDAAFGPSATATTLAQDGPKTAMPDPVLDDTGSDSVVSAIGARDESAKEGA